MFIFNYAVSPYEDWHRQAWAAAFVLVMAIMALNFGIRFLTGRGVMTPAGPTDGCYEGLESVPMFWRLLLRFTLAILAVVAVTGLAVAVCVDDPAVRGWRFG